MSAQEVPDQGATAPAALEDAEIEAFRPCCFNFLLRKGKHWSYRQFLIADQFPGLPQDHSPYT